MTLLALNNWTLNVKSEGKKIHLSFKPFLSNLQTEIDKFTDISILTLNAV